MEAELGNTASERDRLRRTKESFERQAASRARAQGCAPAEVDAKEADEGRLTRDGLLDCRSAAAAVITW